MKSVWRKMWQLQRTDVVPVGTRKERLAAVSAVAAAYPPVGFLLSIQIMKEQQ